MLSQLAPALCCVAACVLLLVQNAMLRRENDRLHATVSRLLERQRLMSKGEHGPVSRPGAIGKSAERVG